MKSFSAFHKGSSHTCLVLLLTAVIWPIAACGPAFAASATGEAQLMFVQIADDLKANPATNTAERALHGLVEDRTLRLDPMDLAILEENE